jgi:hypothetical protein
MQYISMYILWIVWWYSYKTTFRKRVSINNNSDDGDKYDLNLQDLVHFQGTKWCLVY